MLRSAKEQNFQLCNFPNPAKHRVRAIMLTALGGTVQGFPHYFQQASGNLAFFFFFSKVFAKMSEPYLSPFFPLVSSFQSIYKEISRQFDAVQRAFS